jgi:hypothetical protein
LGCDLVSKRRGLGEELQKPAVQSGLVDHKQEVVAADDGAIQDTGHDAEATDFRVNLGDKELASPADLLLLRLDLGARHRVAEHNPLCVKLYATTFV